MDLCLTENFNGFNSVGELTKLDVLPSIPDTQRSNTSRPKKSLSIRIVTFQFSKVRSPGSLIVRPLYGTVASPIVAAGILLAVQVKLIFC